MRPNVLSLTLNGKTYLFKKITTPSQLSFHLSRNNVFNRPQEYGIGMEYRVIDGILKFSGSNMIFLDSRCESIVDLIRDDSLDLLSLYYISKAKK